VPIEQTIAQNLQLHPASVKATIALLDEGQTVPFLARYRKEVTGGLDEDQLRQVAATVERLRALEGRRAAVLATIEEQGKLTEELRSQLLEAQTLAAVEDLYQPYRPKRRTRAGIARERGLQPLADLILEQPRTRTDPAAWAGPHVSDRVPTVEDAWAGARDVVAETVSDDPEVRGPVRERASRWGMIGSARVPDAEDPRRVYETYYEFEARADRLRPYQVLALNRGEAEKVLRVSLEVAERDWRAVVERRYRPDSASPLATMLADAIEDGVHRLLLPAIERDVRRALTENAEEHAIGVFAANLRSLLSEPPVSGHTVLGIDPGFRTGCKVAVVDPTGKVLETATIYPHAPQKRAQEAQASLVRLIRRHGVSLLAIGNGTASRETEQLAAEVIRAVEGVKYVMVSEAGASVYSASPEARAEMPDLDVTLRGAVSIARRLQDPLAELVKIDPKSIGVGMYQHDVDQKRLEEALSAEVETVVNRVGVDVNTASAALLERVAGIGPKLSQAIVAHRDAQGAFLERRQLLKVAGLGPKAYQQAAGFLRIRDGKNPLDAGGIHPESYEVAQKVLARAGVTVQAPLAERQEALERLVAEASPASLASELGVGLPTLSDILEQLARPGRDPRADLPAPVLRSDVLSMEDLRPGMRLAGTVRNVVDFGAFVDIGVKQDGLLHRSQMPPGTDLGVGDVIQVSVLTVDPDRGRIGLGWEG